MHIIYTKHAEDRLKARGIDKVEVERAIESPDELVENEVFIAHRFLNGKMLRVIFRKTSNSYIVITAYITYKERYSR